VASFRSIKITGTRFLEPTLITGISPRLAASQDPLRPAAVQPTSLGLDLVVEHRHVGVLDPPSRYGGVKSSVSRGRAASAALALYDAAFIWVLFGGGLGRAASADHRGGHARLTPYWITTRVNETLILRVSRGI
jgi:hypothetical protein